MTGNTVSYQLPRRTREFNTARVLGCALVVALLAIGYGVMTHAAPMQMLGWIGVLASGALFGLNTVAYEYPVTGATAPTALQASVVNSLNAVVTGDNSATTFVVTHNWGLSAADLAAGFPIVNTEAILAAGNTAAVIVTTKATNSVTFTCTAFTGAGLRVNLQRPTSLVK